MRTGVPRVIERDRPRLRSVLVTPRATARRRYRAGTAPDDVLFLIHRAPRREGVIERGWGPASSKKSQRSPPRSTPSERDARCGRDDRVRWSRVTQWAYTVAYAAAAYLYLAVRPVLLGRVRVGVLPGIPHHLSAERAVYKPPGREFEGADRVRSGPRDLRRLLDRGEHARRNSSSSRVAVLGRHRARSSPAVCCGATAGGCSARASPAP